MGRGQALVPLVPLAPLVLGLAYHIAGRHLPQESGPTAAQGIARSLWQQGSCAASCTRLCSTRSNPAAAAPCAGHARAYVAFDVIYRLLRHLGYAVTYVRNFTDVDDKIIARAAAAGEEPLALARRFIAEFHADMVRPGWGACVVCAGDGTVVCLRVWQLDVVCVWTWSRNGRAGACRGSHAGSLLALPATPAGLHPTWATARVQELLGCLPPDLEPRATEYIPHMVAMIQRIIDHGHAYAVGGDVFFDVASLPGYGRLSGRSQVRNPFPPQKMRHAWQGRPGVVAARPFLSCPRLLAYDWPYVGAGDGHAGGQPCGGAGGGG